MQKQDHIRIIQKYETKLLQPIFDKQPDAIFIQEATNYKDFLKARSIYHVRYDQDFIVAVLLKKSMFETVDDITRSVLEILRDPHTKRLYKK